MFLLCAPAIRADLCSHSTSSPELSSHILWMMHFDLTATTLSVSLQIREAPMVLVLTVSFPPLVFPEALVLGLKSSYPKLGFGFILSLFATFSVTPLWKLPCKQIIHITLKKCLFSDEDEVSWFCQSTSFFTCLIIHGRI